MNIGSNINIVFENHLLEEFTVETLAISPVSLGVGVLFASKNEEDYYLVSLFKVLQKYTDYSIDSDDYSIDSELASFQFTTEEQKHEFIECLPNMSAIDLILLIDYSPRMTYN